MLNVSLGKDVEDFDERLAEKFMKNQKKIMIHTGSLKILGGLQNLYKLDNNQVTESFDTLEQYGNLTGVSIPTVLDKAMFENNTISGNGLLVGITMGFGLDIVEVEKI